jgi:rod shape-determining protein MreD
MSARGARAAKPLNPIVWLGAPMLLSMLATVVLATPLRIFGFALPEPIFPLACAFAWAVIRPSVLPPFALLFLSLFLDVFWDGPQGLWPLALLTSYAGVLWARRLIVGQDFLMMWVWYGVVTTAAFVVGYLVMAFAVHAAPNLISVALMYYLPTLVLYPFAHRLILTYEDADVRFR